MSCENMQYAVVKFISDSTFSEIPMAWVFEEDETQYCWWPPRTANSAMLIANCAIPNFKTWNRYEIAAIKFCSTFESARKHAADVNYTTTDDEQLGRGKRQHVQYNRFDSCEDEDDVDHQPRQYVQRKQSSKNISLVPPPVCPSNLEMFQRNLIPQIEDAAECNIIRQVLEPNLSNILGYYSNFGFSWVEFHALSEFTCYWAIGWWVWPPVAHFQMTSFLGILTYKNHTHNPIMACLVSILTILGSKN